MASTMQLPSDNALGKRKRSGDSHHDDCSEDESELDNYFATYVPISNLPTPPAPKMPTSFPLTPPLDAEDVDVHDPAHYISNLIPQGASLHRLSPSTIVTYLSRSALPQSTIALAACIIDSLSSFFVRTWRKECSALELSLTQQSGPSQPQTMFCISQPPRQQMYGTATPKSALIVLAALSLASGFLDDVKTDAKWWAKHIARGDVSPREIDTTVRCILKDIKYDLLSFTPDVVEEMRMEMFRCTERGRESVADKPSSFPSAFDDEIPESCSVVPFALLRNDYRAAIIANEGLLTPDLSPASSQE